MQKIPNYGSFLQALSLKMQLEKRGHDVYFIDIERGRQIVPAPAAVSKASLLRKFDRYFFKRIANCFFYKKMLDLNTADHVKYLETEKKLPEGECFDLVIIGSDEVFNATVPSSWGFSTQLFGKIDNAGKVVTYAASCGSTTLDSAKACGIVDELRAAMANLAAVSVRDQNTVDFVKGVCEKTPELHVDPVFLTQYEYPAKPIQRKPDLLVYAYANRIDDKHEIRAIKDYAQKHKLEIVSVGMQQRWCNHNITASAFELLEYVKNAACVVTDTFHGTVFSIKYNKRFVTLIRESNRNKLGGLLQYFGLMSRALTSPADIETVMAGDVDYSLVNAKIEAEQQRAYAYLDFVIKEAEKQ